MISCLNISRVLDFQGGFVSDIQDDAPIFGSGLGLDSIDALELGIAIKENFGVTFSTANADTRQHFASINALASYIEANSPKESK